MQVLSRFTGQAEPERITRDRLQEHNRDHYEKSLTKVHLPVETYIRDFRENAASNETMVILTIIEKDIS